MRNGASMDLIEVLLHDLRTPAFLEGLPVPTPKELTAKAVFHH